jgi:hypothetical protein
MSYKVKAKLGRKWATTRPFKTLAQAKAYAEATNKAQRKYGRKATAKVIDV